MVACILSFLSVDETLMKAAKASGVAVRVWTVDDPARIAELAALGCRCASSPTTSRPPSGRSDVLSCQRVRRCARDAIGNELDRGWLRDDFVGENRSHECRRLRQADSDTPHRLRARPFRTTLLSARASWSWTTRTATGLRWASSSWRQQAGGRSPSCRWPRTARRAGCVTPSPIGAARAVVGLGPCSRRIRRPRNGEGPRRCHTTVGARSRLGSHRVDRRLHGNDAGADGRAVGLAVGQLRKACRDRRRSSHGPAPDRGWLRRGHLSASRP